MSKKWKSTKKEVLAIVQKYQGKYLVIGGNAKVIEGQWKTNYLVIIEFPSLELARQWYDSPEYEPLKKLRFAAVKNDALMVEGL